MLPIWAVIVIEFCCAYIFECVISSPLSFKMACKMFDPRKNHPMIFETVIISCTVLIMCPLMSFLAAWMYYPYYTGFNFLQRTLLPETRKNFRNVRRISRKQLQTFIEEWVKFKKILLMKEDREKSLLNKCQVSLLYNRKLGFEKTKRKPIWVPFCLLLAFNG